MRVRMPTVIATPHDNQQNRTLQRTPSMDTLDDRMNQSVRAPLSLPSDSSGDEEEEEEGRGVISPATGLHLSCLFVCPSVCLSDWITQIKKYLDHM